MIEEPRPLLSVVIAATDSPSAVADALRALEGQAPGRIEVIVVEDFEAFCPPLPEGEGRQTFEPPVRYLTAPPGSGVPRLRRLGLEAARGRVVAFTEDSCLAEPGWADAWLSAFDDPGLVAGSGVVEHDDDAPALDWAVVFCEYAPFLGATPDAPPARLAGNNFAALREVALRLSGLEVHEVALLAEIRRSAFCLPLPPGEGRGGGRGTSGDGRGGHSQGPTVMRRPSPPALFPGGEGRRDHHIRTVEAARVRHVRRFGPREAFRDRSRFGLEFGRLRTVGVSPLVRWAGLVAGPAIFGAQVARLASTIVRDRRHLGRFARTLPITLALLAAWSLGEWLGWCLGPPAGRPRETKGRTPGPRPARPGSPRPGCKPDRLDA